MQPLPHDFTLLRQVLFIIVPALAVSNMSLENLHCWASVTCVSRDRTLSVEDVFLNTVPCRHSFICVS